MKQMLCWLGIVLGALCLLIAIVSLYAPWHGAVGLCLVIGSVAGLTETQEVYK